MTALAGAWVVCLLPWPAAAFIGASLQMQLGNPSSATVNTNNHDHYLIQRTVESIDYSDSLGVPRWASWDLTAGDIGSAPRSTSFYTDTTLPSGFTRVTDGDYVNSGYDRGHMCPSLDRTDTTANNDLVFFMSNILPQHDDNNTGPWEACEYYCQALANAGNEMLIISGPSGLTGSRIPSGKAVIPGYTWKIAVVVPAGSGSALSRITASTRVIAVKMPNVAGIHSVPWTNYMTSAKQIQTDTGYTFFSALSASISEVLLAKVDGTPAPSIGNFSPTNGRAATLVTINGVNFTGVSSVKFNKVSASFKVVSSVKITATVPAAATTGPLTVVTPGGQAASAAKFTVMPAPSISSFSPTSGHAGTLVTINGANFTGASSVKFNGVGGSFTVVSNVKITALVPAAATTGPLTVVTPGGQAASAAKFTVVLAPSISSFSPASGSAGTLVTINGANFTGASSVKFNGVSASFTVVSSVKITVTVPGAATTGRLTVVTPGGQATSATSFTVAGGGGGGTVVISQVYGGGGNSGSTYKNDFIELYNRGTTTVNLSTYSVQYGAKDGTYMGGASTITPLSGSIAPGHYYLIREFAGTGGTTSLPTPQASGTINLSATDGKVALSKLQTPVGNPLTNTNVVDLVGYGAANAYEGAGPAPTLTNTKSALRAGNGAIDTNNNNADFTAGAVNPRN